MNRPERHFRARLATLAAGGALIAALFPLASTVLAAAPSVTAATGGGAISLDKSSAYPGTGTYTTLTGPVIDEGSTFGTFSTGTIVLTLPGGFEFSTSFGSVGKTGDCVISGLSVATGSATVTISTSSSTTPCVITFSGLRVRPTGTTPTSGNITNTTGTATGVPGGATNYGTLAAVAGAPILTFTTQPSSTATAGTAFAPDQPAVTSKDRFNNLRSGDSVALSIKSGTGTAGAVLLCTTNPVTTVAGVAAFAGCKIDKSGSGYRLHAAVTGGTAADSNTITVDPGAPVQIGFATQPARGIPNIWLGSQPVVAIQDAQGNTVPSAGATTVTLALTTNPGSATLTCTGGLSKGTTSGLAAFSGCRLDKVGVEYKITASAPGYSNVVSSSFDVADRLAFTTQPAGAVGGIAFTTQPVVTVRAGASAAAVNDNGTVVTLAIKSGTGSTGATLTCTDGLTRTASVGVATFYGCSIDKSSPTGNPYVLVATSPSLASAESSSLAVVAGAASKVLFTVQPAATNVGVIFAAAPAVSITDAGGNVVTTGSDSIRSITLSIGTNPGGGTLTCTGGLTRAAVAGVATFTGCSIDRGGTGYTLVATSTSLTSATSSAFNITVPGATISLTRSHGMITYGESVNFAVQFGTGGANRPFVLEYTSVGIPWTTIANLVTNGSGFASLTYTPARTGYVRARFLGAPDLGAATSTVYIVGVRQTITLSPHHVGTTAIGRGTSVTFSSRVRPIRLDLASSQVTFRFYQKVSGAWVLKYERHVATDTSGVARTTFRFGVGGSWYVRAFAPRTLYNSISRFTQLEYYLVR